MFFRRVFDVRLAATHRLLLMFFLVAPLMCLRLPVAVAAGPGLIYGPITARAAYSATTLVDGRLLLAGGERNNGSAPISISELYEPTTGRWVSTGLMVVPLSYHGAARLANGQILAVGGYTVTSFSGRQVTAVAQNLRTLWTGRWTVDWRVGDGA